MQFFLKWGILGGVARFAGYVIFGLIVLSAPLVWAVRALVGKILQLAQWRRIPVIPAPERSSDDARMRQILDDSPNRVLGNVCQTGHGCGVVCGCPPTTLRDKGGALMANQAGSSFEEEEDRRMVMALDGTSAYYDSDYFDMEKGPGGPMGSFEQAILWIAGTFVAVVLIAPVLLIGAGLIIWHFWPVSWRLW